MGASPYWYFTPYEPDADSALKSLRQREFAAGRYSPVQRRMNFPVDPAKPSPGAGHASIEDALEASAEEGTRSILDIERVGDEPDYNVACAVTDADLLEVFGTTQPTHEMVESNDELFERIERGQAIYLTVYKDGLPDELYFAGYSFD